MSAFLTISGASTGLYKEKGSKFLAYAYPVSNEGEVREVLALLKKEHPKARHVCYAYQLGSERLVYKCSDDGEPHNSAGQPILGQIKSFNVTNLIVAVVRYFGGTKLGVGGLTAAYKEAARDSLEKAVIVGDIEREEMTIEVEYVYLTELMNFAKQNNVRILGHEIGDICRVRVFVPLEQVIDIEKAVLQFKNVKIL